MKFLKTAISIFLYYLMPERLVWKSHPVQEIAFWHFLADENALWKRYYIYISCMLFVVTMVSNNLFKGVWPQVADCLMEVTFIYSSEQAYMNGLMTWLFVYILHCSLTLVKLSKKRCFRFITDLLCGTRFGEVGSALVGLNPERSDRLRRLFRVLSFGYRFAYYEFRASAYSIVYAAAFIHLMNVEGAIQTTILIFLMINFYPPYLCFLQLYQMGSLFYAYLTFYFKERLGKKSFLLNIRILTKNNLLLFISL